MITLPGGTHILADSTGKPIKPGDRIRFRGQEFTLKAVGPNSANDTATLIFEEPITHTTEIPEEWTVDLVVS